MHRTTLIVLAASLSAAVNAQSKPATDPAKPICRSHTETGSLAKRIRECHTAAEWQQLAEQGRKQADDYQQVMNSSRSGN